MGWCGGHHGFTSAGLALVALILAEPARAASFSWTAPEGCATAEAVRSRLERDFGPGFDDIPGVAFEAAVSERPGGFDLVLQARGKDGAVYERRIGAATCVELVDALAAAMSLALESFASPEKPTAPEDETPAKSEQPAPPRPRPKAFRPSVDASSPVVPVVGLGMMLDVGALPAPALGVAALAGLEWTRFDLWATGALTTPQRQSFEGGGGEFDLVFGGVSACYAPERSTWEIGACLTGEAGRIRGMGVNVQTAREGSALWLALVPSARLALRPAPRRWGVFLQGGLVIPLTRRPFELTEVGVVHTPAPLGFRSLAGIELGFR
jgi:hypothetical protein